MNYFFKIFGVDFRFDFTSSQRQKLNDRKTIKLIFSSYLAAIVISALILMTPACSKIDLSFVDAIFTSSSAISCTGLIVKSTGNDFTFFGQFIILLIIQLGGFGYMSLAILLAIAIGKKLSFTDRMILKESYEYPTMQGVVRLLIRIFQYMLFVELVGALFLSARFAFDMPPIDAVWNGIFHAVSAFNNAGFSLFDSSMIGYKGDIFMNFFICLLIIIGGLGYMIIFELLFYRQKLVPKLTPYAKIVLISSFALIALGAFLFFSLEHYNPKTLGNLTYLEQFLSSIFASVNLRTSGFNSLDLSGASDSTLFFSTIFMLIGGAPASTAGGIKITTFVVLGVTAWFFLKGEPSPILYKRVIPQETIYKALSIVMVTIFYISISTIIIVEIEQKDFTRTFFEIISAFATVGISTGDGNVASYSNLFSDFSKILLAIIMFMGKVGVLTFSAIILGKPIKKNIQYPEGKIIL